ncbi:FAD-binding domain-containing protein [Mucidula mucida]|nr:FAD-binding domain-containing protein [Mucidula mucida]
MGLIWLTHPVLWHSSRETGGPKETLTDAENKLFRSKWHDWYQADWDYGQTTLAFFCTDIAIMLLFQVISKIRAKRQRRSASSGLPGGIDRIVAACRYAAARQFRVRKHDWYTPPLGVGIALCGIFTFLMGNTSFCFPVIQMKPTIHLALLLSARPYYWPNETMGHSPPIATRAGWMSIAIKPFMIVFATKVNWIGILAGTSHEKSRPIIGGLRSLCTYLVGLSWGILRNRYYEVFKKACQASFHFWATLGPYGTSWLIRVVRTHYYSGFGLPATLETLPDNMLKVSIQIPDRLKWTPGQNVFVRFLGLGPHVFSSHPFTVASIPTKDRHSLDLVLRVKGGITRKLANIAAGKTAKSTRVFVDGHMAACGHKAGMVCKRIVYIVAVTNTEGMAWMNDDLAAAQQVLGDKILEVQIYVTGGDGSRKTKDVSEKEGDLHFVWACKVNNGRVAFAACGPDSLLYDVRNAVADRQLAITDGFGRCKDVYLHTESFGW